MTVWPVLASLPAPEIEKLLSVGRRQRFVKGEFIMRYGDPPACLHLVDRGQATIRVRTPHGDQAILRILGPGATCGELALINARVLHTATVTAIRSCETIAVHRAHFERLRTDYPGLDRSLLQSLSAQVDQLSQQLLDVLFMPTSERVLRRVISLVDDFGCVIPLTQEDLALMSGTTRPTVNEALRAIERAGAIRIGRGHIHVLDRELLAGGLAQAEARRRAAS